MYIKYFMIIDELSLLLEYCFPEPLLTESMKPAWRDTVNAFGPVRVPEVVS